MVPRDEELERRGRGAQHGERGLELVGRAAVGEVAAVYEHVGGRQGVAEARGRPVPGAKVLPPLILMVGPGGAAAAAELVVGGRVRLVGPLAVGVGYYEETGLDLRHCRVVTWPSFSSLFLLFSSPPLLLLPLLLLFFFSFSLSSFFPGFLSLF